MFEYKDEMELNVIDHVSKPENFSGKEILSSGI